MSLASRVLSGLFGGSRNQPLSRAESFFLSKFIKPNNPAQAGDYLAAILQKDAIQTARMFRDAGLIEDAQELSSLLASVTTVSLKQALRDAGLKVFGKKEELARRLFELKPDVARRMISGPYFVLSTEGRVRVEAFQKTEDEASEKYTTEWLRCFDRGDLKGALAAHRAYSEWEIKPPASFNPMGITLSDERMLEMYLAIVEAAPGILGKVSPSNLAYLRRCAAWDWAGAGKGGSLRFPVPLDFDSALAPDVSARMVSFAARHNVEMRTYKRLGGLKCEIMDAGGDSCSYCRKFSGKSYSVAKMPELPHPQCTHEMGCRCIASLSF